MKAEEKKSTIKALVDVLVEVEELYAAGIRGDGIRLDSVYASTKFFNKTTDGAYKTAASGIAKRVHHSVNGVNKLEGQLEETEHEIVHAIREMVRGNGAAAKKLMNQKKGD